MTTTPPPRPSIDIADAIAPQPPSPRFSDNKNGSTQHGKVHDWKSGSDDADEKKVPNTTTVTVTTTSYPSESVPRYRNKTYARSMKDFFSWGTILQFGAVLIKFGQFMGPGSIISVAYIDPDNFQTAITSGANFEFKLLFMILVSNLIAIYLQVRIYLFFPGLLGGENLLPTMGKDLRCGIRADYIYIYNSRCLSS
jgi:hypothetical protein